ncbi:folylpolyglutamate synthase, mitochondrial isoform X1 [Balaenoptera ricei]|uniref:folylpolyglutamate synthase, mitochondrial isoform X1 n=2 Tax=Balaenoptera ricei TaxID=2746895 RepID=UPI0028BE2A22|nr:folylpolyglutamate synthase, mitochondrial isoform X1 [Balaenoptera ricei]
MSRARCHLRAALFLAAVSSRGATTGVAARRVLSAWPAPQEPGMEYQDAVRTLNTLQTNANYLEQVKRQRGDPQTQLEAMKLYLARSGLQVEDLDQLNIIHITGTKGKGSTCAFTERILRSYGLKTGFFSSPHLVQVRERIRINGQPISPELFTKYFWRLYHRLEETKDDSSCVSMPGYFRFLTLMAFHVFLQEKVDLAVMEVGIGGAYDCTNIVKKPVVCGVSSLGIDHTGLLGDTMEKIAWQKGGIFKCGIPAFTVLQPDGPLAVLRDRAQQISCPLYLCPPLEALEEGGPLLTLGLEGEHQQSNAALALQLARCWLQQKGYQDTGELKASRPSLLGQLPLAPVFQPTSHMQHGLRDTEWPGRTQLLRRGPLTWYLDGAHTTSSMQACVRWFRQALHSRERPGGGSEVRVLLFNSTGDRDSAALLKLLQPCQFDYTIFCPNLTEVSSTDNADQQNFTVTLDQVLLRCLAHQQHWSRLHEDQASPEAGGPAPLLLAPRPAHTHSTSSLVFSCISHALQWISQGRDPVFQPASPPRVLFAHPVAGSGAIVLQEAAAIHVLVTGSLHLVGGVLKLLEPSLSQ